LEDVDIEMVLAITLIRKRFDHAFDISECSYDYYSREEVKKATEETKKLWKVIEILEELYE
jgi:hypothetical protein